MMMICNVFCGVLRRMLRVAPPLWHQAGLAAEKLYCSQSEGMEVGVATRSELTPGKSVACPAPGGGTTEEGADHSEANRLSRPLRSAHLVADRSSGDCASLARVATSRGRGGVWPPAGLRKWRWDGANADLLERVLADGGDAA